MNLPILIFLESHDDPITTRILLKLAPELKARGYQFFLDEKPEVLSIDAAIRAEEEFEKIYLELSRQFKVHGLNICSEMDINKFVNLHLLDKKRIYDLDTSYFPGLDVIPDFKFFYEFFLKRVERNCLTQELLTYMKKNHVEYKSIDLGVPQNFLELTIEQSKLLMAKRDMAMASHLIEKREVGVFARIGLLHAFGIQNIIRQKFASLDSDNKFKFFFVHSDKSHSMKNLLKIKNAKEFKLKDTGLEVVNIDASNVDDDNVIAQILNVLATENHSISAKKNKLINHSVFKHAFQKLKDIPQHIRKDKPMSIKKF